MFVGLGKFLLLVKLQAWRSGPRPTASGNEKNGSGGSNRALRFQAAASGPRPLAIVDQERESEKQNRGRKRPLVTLDRTARQPRVNVSHLHLGQSVAEELLHRLRSVLEMDVKPACCLSNLAQPRLIELRFHDLSLGVFYERSPAAFSLDGNKRASRRPNPDGEDAHSGVRGFFRCPHRIAAQFFAIGENDQGAITDCRFAKGPGGQSNCGRDVSAAFGNDLRIELVDGIDGGIVVDREWSLQESLAGKCD